MAGTLTLQGLATPGQALPVTGGASWTLVGLAALCYLLGGLALGASSGRGLRGQFAVIRSSLWGLSSIREGAGTEAREASHPLAARRAPRVLVTAVIGPPVGNGSPEAAAQEPGG